MLFRAVRICLLGTLLFTQSAQLAAQLEQPQDAEIAGERQGVYLAPGWGKLSFTPPAPGSYSLPAIDSAGGGEVLNSAGDKLQLDDLYGDKVTLLSFIYRTCDDANGCPLSTMVLHTTARKIAESDALKDKLRLITLSFDPLYDTPQVMQDFAESIVGDTGLDWHFLTSQSDTHIQPILQSYQQSVVVDDQAVDDQATDNQTLGEDANKPTGRKFSHLLRVFLIDTNKQIRNIYSLAFLHPDVLINDVKTLLMEDSSAPQENLVAPIKAAR